jgi:hypothetical protein
MLRDEKGRRLEEKMTKKGSVISKVVEQQYEPSQNNDVKDKPREGTQEARKNNNREAEEKNIDLG